MPPVIVTEAAVAGLQRCRSFLAEKNSQAAKRAGQVIERQFLILETNPEIGILVPETPELRELVIGFGASGYVALYRYEPDNNAVYILAFRHQREAGH